jgi:hypothetical protein
VVLLVLVDQAAVEMQDLLEPQIEVAAVAVEMYPMRLDRLVALEL